MPEGLDLTPDQRIALRTRMSQMGPAMQRRLGVGRRMARRMLPGIVALTAVFVLWIFWLIGAKLPTTRFLIVNVAGILTFQALMWVVIAYSINRGMAPLVWQSLNDIGVGVCMGCGYILEYLPADLEKCPECGEALHPPTNASS